MGELPSPYLAAIQRVTGKIPGEKFRTLNRIAKRIIESENQDEPMQSTFTLSNISEAMQPLVRVLVARLSRQFEGICESLKSDDCLVVNWALRAKWFFNGSHENCRVRYYQKKIFSVVSLHNRHKIIKALAKNLTANPAIAEEFYTELTFMYEEKQVHLLLMACSESFIRYRITEHGLRLNNRMVRILFNKYPGLVVEYLMLSKKSDDEFERNLRPVNLKTHASFLPRLFKKYPETFVELIKMHDNNFNIKLGRRSTAIFFKKFTHALKRNPPLFLPMLNLKVVHRNLCDFEFDAIFKQLFPPDMDSFDFDKLAQYLEFLPNERKLSLMFSTFEEHYGLQLLDCYEKITPSIILMHPRKDRANLVERIHRERKKRGLDNPTIPWVCYAPCDELLWKWKIVIRRKWISTERQELIMRLIFSCRNNADNNTFLRLIKYIATNHMREPESFFMNIFEYISRRYPINTFTAEHWDMLVNLINAAYKKYPTLYNKMPLKLIIGAIRCDFDGGNTEDTETMKFLIELLLLRKQTDWRIFKDNFRYDRICLEHFISHVLKSDNSNKRVTDNPLISLLLSIKEFNDEVTEAKSDVPVICIENYPALVRKVRPFINGHIGNNAFTRNLKVAVRNLNENLYNAWVSENVRKIERLPPVIISDLNSEHTWKMLKTDPQSFDCYWQTILKDCVKKIYKIGCQCKGCPKTDPLARKFIKMSRWCQKLPMDFIDRLRFDIPRHAKGRDLITLALLIDGPALENIAAHFYVTAVSTAPRRKFAQICRKSSCCILRALSVAYPPVSLERMRHFCDRHCKHEEPDYLLTVSRRTAISKVIPFVVDLLNEAPNSVSTRKLGIRLLCMVIHPDHLLLSLMSLWSVETNQSVRKLLFKNMLKVFKTFPSPEYLQFIEICMDRLTPDDRYALKLLMKFDDIPNDFIEEYFSKLFQIVCRLSQGENGLQTDFFWFYFTKLLNIDKNIVVLFSEDLHKQILKKYVFYFPLPKFARTVAHNYLINYIVTARDKLEVRLDRFKKEFIKIVNKNWNIPHHYEPSFYPVQYFAFELVSKIVKDLNKHPIKRKFAYTALMAAFDSNLEVYQDPHFYLLLTFACIVDDKVPPMQLVTYIGRLLSKFEEFFDSDHTELIARCLFVIMDSTISDFGYQIYVIMGLLVLGNNFADNLAIYLLRFQPEIENYPRLAKLASLAIP